MVVISALVGLLLVVVIFKSRKRKELPINTGIRDAMDGMYELTWQLGVKCGVV